MLYFEQSEAKKLGIVDDFWTYDWDYPELVYQKSQQHLQEFNLA